MTWADTLRLASDCAAAYESLLFCLSPLAEIFIEVDGGEGARGRGVKG